MSEQFVLPAQERTEHGTSHSRRLRHQERIPAILYGDGKAPLPLTIEHRLIKKALELDGFTSSVISLEIGGKKVNAVLKALQRHTHKPKIMHADFMRVSATAKITMRVPLNFVGGDVCPGVKLQGGIVSHNMTDIEVQCLPGNLPENIEVDLSNLNVDKAIHLSDLVLPKDVELTTNIENVEHNLPVAAITIPRGSLSQDDAGETGDADTDSAATDKDKKDDK